MTRKEFIEYRNARKSRMDRHSPDAAGAQVIVGMGTSGMAAGARETLAAIEAALKERGLADVAVKQAGSIGLDFAEPTVEVIMPGMPPVIYGRVDAATARRIVDHHIVGKSLVEEHIYDRPAADILRGR